MINDKKQWPSEVFRPVFSYIRAVCPKITARRAARITKGVLAARAALDFSMSRNRREEMPDVPLESDSGVEQRQRTPRLF